MKQILIVEDDMHIGNMLEEALSDAGYGVYRSYSGTEAVLFLSKRRPNLVLLDLMLPGLRGEDVLPLLKGIPVIVVSAKVEPDQKVELLLGGAADYITKPFYMKELLARVEVQLRKFSADGSGDVLIFEDMTLDRSGHFVTIGEKAVKLTRTEHAILKVLMENPTRVMTKSLLLERISYDTPDCTESSLKIHISNLRKKLREVSNREYIESVWGIGFKMLTE